jgi:hypothetical protein
MRYGDVGDEVPASALTVGVNGVLVVYVISEFIEKS